MYVRIARFEGVEPGGIDRQAEELQAALDAARAGRMPEGIPEAPFRALAEHTTRVVAVASRTHGVILDLVFTETQDELQAVHEALDAMSPASGAGHRVSVERYEVLADETLR